MRQPDHSKMTKKAQMWTLDYMSAVLIFVIAIILSVRIIIDLTYTDKYESTYKDAVYLSDSLIGEGVPLDWNASSVVLPGLTNSSHRIDGRKLGEYSLMNYESTKSNMHLTHEYLFFFRNSTGIINMTQCTYGYPMLLSEGCEPNLSTIRYDNLIKIDRIVILNSTLVSLEVYVWD